MRAYSNGSAIIAALAGGEIWANRQVCPTIVGVCAEVRPCFNGAPHLDTATILPLPESAGVSPARYVATDNPNPPTRRRRSQGLPSGSARKSRGYFVFLQSARGLAHSKTLRVFRNHRITRSVLECGGPPPLFPEAYHTVPRLIGTAINALPARQLKRPHRNCHVRHSQTFRESCRNPVFLRFFEFFP